MKTKLNNLKNNSLFYIKKNSLFYILLILQAVSLGTTIEGAKIVLSSLEPYYILGIKIEAYYLLGAGIQFLLLWIFTIGKNEIKSSLRKWILILVYTFASIYTSFFSFYQGIADENLTQNNNDNAINKHNDLKLFIYTQQVGELNHINTRIETAKKNKIEQRLDGEPKKVRERTKKIETLGEEKDNLSNKYQYTKNQEVKSNFQKTLQELESQKAIKIFRDDQAALKAVPPEIKKELESKEKFDIKEEFSKDKYMSETSYFLVPFTKVKEGNAEAILALVLASIVDATSLILGSIVDKKGENREGLKKFRAKMILLSNALSKGLKEFLPNLIEEIGHLILTILRALGSIIHGIFFGLISAKNRGLQVFFFNANSIKIKGNRQDFLSILWNSIEFYSDNREPRIIYKKLISSTQNNNESFRSGYKRLVLDMHHLEWLEKQIENNEIFFKIKEYDKFNNWSQKEESKQFEQEKHTLLSPNDYYTLINLPKREAFYKRTLKKIKFWLKQIF